MKRHEVKFDCSYFDGAKPCRPKAACAKCRSYRRMPKRALIIKLASAGDVLRTTSLLPAFKSKYPKAHITWLVDRQAQELIKSNPFIDRILCWSTESVLQLLVEEFDFIISLDKAREAASLATLIRAKTKCGFGLNKYGKIYPFNKESEYLFRLGIDDRLKFKENSDSYQRLIYEACKLKFRDEKYQLFLPKNTIKFAETFLSKNNIRKDDLLIGINTGAGKVFANKYLKPVQLSRLTELLQRKLKARILLLGGPQEEKVHKYLKEKSNGRLIDSGCNNSLLDFAALIDRCTFVITADTMALHMAVALGKPVVALFGPTCHQEIDLYGKGRKIVTDKKCAPCYKNKCIKPNNCMDSIKLGRVIEAARELVF